MTQPPEPIAVNPNRVVDHLVQELMKAHRDLALLRASHDALVEENAALRAAKK